MSADLSHYPTPIAGDAVPGRPAFGRLRDRLARIDPRRLSTHRMVLVGYVQLLAGTGGRLGLQAVYFLVLVNALSLAQMGAFASVSAAGVLIGSLAGFGFQAFVMRAAAGRRSSLGASLGAFYTAFAVSLPVMAAIAAAAYALLFADIVPVPAYAAIVLVEVAIWRQIELLVQVNSGLGRFGAASKLVSLPTGFRAAAALGFWACGGGSVEAWSLWYLAGNAAASVVLNLCFHPRVRLRLRRALIVGRIKDGLLYVVANVLFQAQNEADKLIVLALAGERAAGLYAISMRLIDLTGAPLRPVFMMYSRRIIQAGRATRKLIGECLRIEAAVALVSTGLILALAGALHLRPGLLGANVSAAAGMIAAIAAVPAARNLLEFHGEMFFAFGSLGLRAVVIAALVTLKAAGVVLLLVLMPGTETWVPWLNAIYAVVYALSFVTIYGLLARSATS